MNPFWDKCKEEKSIVAYIQKFELKRKSMCYLHKVAKSDI